MNTQRPTPRTDAYIGDQDGTYMTEGEIAMCNFARELERENEAMRAAIQASVTALRAWPKAGHGMSTDFTLQSQAFRSGQSALATLKPFLPETPTK